MFDKVPPVLVLTVLMTVALAATGAQVQAQQLQRTPQAQADLVASLPGYGPLNNLTLFSGYITVNVTTPLPGGGSGLTPQAFFYVFVESQGNPVTDPLLWWFQGGPGCSPMGMGLLSEVGGWRDGWCGSWWSWL